MVASLDALFAGLVPVADILNGEGECPDLHPQLSHDALGVRAEDGRTLVAAVTEYRGDWKFFREPLPGTLNVWWLLGYRISNH